MKTWAVVGSVEGGSVVMHFRPLQEGEQSEVIVFDQGWSIDLKGILEPCTTDCDHQPKPMKLTEIP